MEPRLANPFAAPETEPDVYRPQQQDVMSMALAERGTRFAGALLDNVLYVGVIIPGGVLLAMSNAESVAGWILLALPLLGLWIYQMVLVATTGQSLAKKWLKMKIVKVDGTPVDFVSGVLLRSWAMVGLAMIPFLGNFVGLVDALMIFGDERQCLHDKIASTKVIDITSMY